MIAAAALAAVAVAALAQAPGTLTLEQALKEAQARNLDLQVAAARLTQAREISRKVWANYLPQLSVGGSYTRNSEEAKIGLPTGYYVRNVFQPQGPPYDPAREIGPENPPGAQTSYILFPSGFAEVTIQRLDQVGVQAQLNQALIAPALWPAIRNAYLGEEIAALGVEAARREVLFGVAQLYYGAAGLKQAIGVQERLLQLARDREKDAGLRFRAGAALKLGLLRAQIDRSRAEQDLKRAQNAYQSARIALATLLDRAPDFEVVQPPAPVLPQDLQALQDGALERRPDVRQARTSEELARGARAGTWFKYAPNVGLIGTYRWANVTGFTGQNDAWAVGVGLNWTLWDGGLRESELRENDAKVVEAVAARRSAEIKARDELQRALLDLDSARASRAKAEEQLKLARESAELTRVTLQAGAASDLDVAEASAALTGAETAAVAEALNADLAALRVLKAAGAFDPR